MLVLPEWFWARYEDGVWHISKEMGWKNARGKCPHAIGNELVVVDELPRAAKVCPECREMVTRKIVEAA